MVVVSHQDSESSPPSVVHHQIIQQNQQQQQQQLPLQELVQQHRLDDEEDQDDLDDEQLELDQDDSSESGDRIIYPWMKKIHVAGVGEFKLFNGFFVLSVFVINFALCEGNIIINNQLLISQKGLP